MLLTSASDRCSRWFGRGATFARRPDSVAWARPGWFGVFEFRLPAGVKPPRLEILPIKDGISVCWAPGEPHTWQPWRPRRWTRHHAKMDPPTSLVHQNVVNPFREQFRRILAAQVNQSTNIELKLSDSLQALR